MYDFTYNELTGINSAFLKKTLNKIVNVEILGTENYILKFYCPLTNHGANITAIQRIVSQKYFHHNYIVLTAPVKISRFILVLTYF